MKLHSNWLTEAISNTQIGENLSEELCSVDFDTDEIAADILHDEDDL